MNVLNIPFLVVVDVFDKNPVYRCAEYNYQDHQRIIVLKRYVLRLFISLKYITTNVVNRNNGRIVVTASTVEHSIKNSLECGPSCNAKAAAVVGEVLAMRLKVEGLEQGQGRGIHVDKNGVKLVLVDTNDNTSRPS
ncbi:hypothetical protein ACOSQ4_004367 [Xanthoceras sorbifolium]